MKFGLDENSIEEIRTVLSRFPEIEKVLIYGSRAMGNYRPGSDIDLAIVGSDLTHKDLLTIGASLDDLGMLYTFDVLLHDQLTNQDLKNHIDRVGKEIYLAKVETSKNQYGDC